VKQLSKLAVIVLLIWAWFPTADPTDLFITGTVIGLIGLPAYLLVSVLIILYLYNKIPGTGLKAKFRALKAEAKRVL